VAAAAADTPELCVAAASRIYGMCQLESDRTVHVLEDWHEAAAAAAVAGEQQQLHIVPRQMPV
jgi:hypothetical protein